MICFYENSINQIYPGMGLGLFLKCVIAMFSRIVDEIREHCGAILKQVELFTELRYVDGKIYI